MVEKEHNLIFYYNILSKEKSWNKPNGFSENADHLLSEKDFSEVQSFVLKFRQEIINILQLKVHRNF